MWLLLDLAHCLNLGAEGINSNLTATKQEATVMGTRRRRRAWQRIGSSDADASLHKEPHLYAATSQVPFLKYKTVYVTERHHSILYVEGENFIGY